MHKQTLETKIQLKKIKYNKLFVNDIIPYLNKAEVGPDANFPKYITDIKLLIN